ncbi:MAG: hypothetical protein KatS3mg118_3542 [Paracoccaceae bacterium]|nr:MAG: hypothetical protein KatS3mg118_3542 [Paracoccaceae bacterium]
MRGRRLPGPRSAGARRSCWGRWRCCWWGCLSSTCRRARRWSGASAVLVALGLGGLAPRRIGGREVLRAIAAAGRDSAQILLVCAVAGMIIGLMSTSGFSFGLSFVLLDLGRGSLTGLLLLTAAVSILLGMGLPTTGVYLLLATLAAPPLVRLGIGELEAHFLRAVFRAHVDDHPAGGAGRLRRGLGGGGLAHGHGDAEPALRLDRLHPALRLRPPAGASDARQRGRGGAGRGGGAGCRAPWSPRRSSASAAGGCPGPSGPGRWRWGWCAILPHGGVAWLRAAEMVALALGLGAIGWHLLAARRGAAGSGRG